MLSNIVEGTEVMRYHSLMIDAQQQLPDELVIIAEVTPGSVTEALNGREIMALQHSKYPIYGVQFHPESFATLSGRQLLDNFVQSITAK